MRPSETSTQAFGAMMALQLVIISPCVANLFNFMFVVNRLQDSDNLGVTRESLNLFQHLIIFINDEMLIR